MIINKDIDQPSLSISSAIKIYIDLDVNKVHTFRRMYLALLYLYNNEFIIWNIVWHYTIIASILTYNWYYSLKCQISFLVQNNEESPTEINIALVILTRKNYEENKKTMHELNQIVKVKVVWLVFVVRIHNYVKLINEW